MTAADPLISVVIPAYNAQAYLAECLASVRAQAGAFKLEVIVVDDGSTDATPQVARQHTGVTCLTQANNGPGAARNAGIAKASGEFVAFLDADDLWPPGKLAAQLEVLKRHAGAGLVFGDCRQFDDAGPRDHTEFEAGSLGQAGRDDGEVVPDAYLRLLANNFITTGSVVLPRRMLYDVGGFAEDLRLVEDLDLWLRIARRHPIARCSQVCLLRRRHAENTSRDAQAMGLAYLEVLRRQRALESGVPAAPQPELKRLAAREYVHLAELALSRGDAVLAAQRATQAMAEQWKFQALWQLCRAWTLRQLNR